VLVQSYAVTAAPPPGPVVLTRYGSLALQAGVAVQVMSPDGTRNLVILNTGPGNLYVSTGSTPGPNAQSMLIPPLKMAPVLTTAGPVWLSADQNGGVSIATVARR
jgi:hypothetical protein